MNIKKEFNLFKKDFARAAALLWLSGKKTLIINVLLQLLLSTLPITSLYCVKLLIENLLKTNVPLQIIVELIVLFGAVQLLTALATQYSSYINTIFQQQLTDHLSIKVLNKAIDVDYEYYENPAYHDNLHLAQQQSIYKAAQILTNFNALLLNSLSLLLLIGFFFTLNSLFGLLFMVLSVPLACIRWYAGYASLRMEQQFAPQERESNYLHQVVTGLSFAKELRVFGFGKSFIAKFHHIRLNIFTQKRDLQLKLMVYSLIAETFEVIAMICIFGLLAKSVWDKTITIALFITYIQGFQRLQNTSRGFLQAIVQVFQQRLFLKDLFAFLQLPSKNSFTKNAPIPDFNKSLSIENVSFTYPQTNKMVLKDISMSCNAGQMIAIVGENGSGKSTLVKLLAKLYSLQTGVIKLNGIAINDINFDTYSDKSVFLFQDFEKYYFSVADNITLGKKTNAQSFEAIQAAARLSGADEFITGLSEGYQTRLGRTFKGSEQLSGGQWQKLALSRIFYKDADLVILDEPTSALDPKAEFNLFNHVKDIAKNKIVILVSHRLYNLKMADHIYVMENGMIAEQGSFDTLIEKEGLFKSLYDLQKL